jgi:hypothetical protein
VPVAATQPPGHPDERVPLAATQPSGDPDASVAAPLGEQAAA